MWPTSAAMVSPFALDMRQDWGQYVGRKGERMGEEVSWMVVGLGGMFVVDGRLFLVVASKLVAPLLRPCKALVGESFSRAVCFSADGGVQVGQLGGQLKPQAMIGI